MALEKVDIRCKFDPVTVAFVEAEADARNVDKCVILREVLDSWRDVQQRKYIQTQNKLRAKGLDGAVEGIPGIDQGRSGQAGATQNNQALTWDED